MVKKTLFSIVIIVLVLAAILPFVNHNHIPQKREDFISLRNEIREEMLNHEDYSCCLMNSCTYCIEKTPGHGEGAACHCLDDVMNGKHPCGECIGEILEGHGNPLIAEYFAEAIAEETGHKEAIMQIIEEKYDMPVSEQI